MEGTVLDGRYRLDALLGEGGMGSVYRATQLANDRRVAVKLLKPHLTTDQVAAERFVREARATIKVDSPHAVKVSDFGITPEGDYYMVLEYLDGRTVQRELDVDGPFEPRRVLHIAQHALHALGTAHAAGIIHRDIKPDNLLLMRVGDDADYTKVLDFGVAKLLVAPVTPLTQQGMVFGTPEFMSPEQACGQQLDGRSDLYSLAATMFAMLTGRGMYNAVAAIDWLTAHARQPPPHLVDGKPELAEYRELDRVLQQCLAKHREMRPENASAMAALLASVEGTLTGAARPTVTFQAPTAKPTVFSHTTFTSAVVIAPPRKYGLWIALGAVAIAAMIVAAIVIASRDRPKRVAPPPPPAAVKPPAVIDAGAADAPAEIDAAIPLDASIAIRTHPTANPAIEQHVAAAESARRAGKWMKEIEEAHAALALDARNVKATLLVADGLFHENDIPTGCRYLRSLRTNPLARARAHQAGCSAD